MTNEGPAKRPTNHNGRVECGKTGLSMTKQQDDAAARPPIESQMRQERPSGFGVRPFIAAFPIFPLPKAAVARKWGKRGECWGKRQ
jgi:hypothetical protein